MEDARTASRILLVDDAKAIADNLASYAHRRRGGQPNVHGQLVAFFGQALKGDRSDLLQGPSPTYPEVTFESR